MGRTERNRKRGKRRGAPNRGFNADVAWLIGGGWWPEEDLGEEGVKRRSLSGDEEGLEADKMRSGVLLALPAKKSLRRSIRRGEESAAAAAMKAQRKMRGSIRTEEVRWALEVRWVAEIHLATLR
ncbi:uncharacterized protein A4U43_C01F15980 [Asparagus officinalis]|uniref:Uncharacterized protein n=1 Tax=Asparagus officinalis TaxID=4686 RepID=A0A5P1FTF0_ASPOF|nr:uncharacterized protein A4U43_C01F15980 [Asparagus officinalis]